MTRGLGFQIFLTGYRAVITSGWILLFSVELFIFKSCDGLPITTPVAVGISLYGLCFCLALTFLPAKFLLQKEKVIRLLGLGLFAFSWIIWIDFPFTMRDVMYGIFVQKWGMTYADAQRLAGEYLSLNMPMIACLVAILTLIFPALFYSRHNPQWQ